MDTAQASEERLKLAQQYMTQFPAIFDRSRIEHYNDKIKPSPNKAQQQRSRSNMAHMGATNLTQVLPNKKRFEGNTKRASFDVVDITTTDYPKRGGFRDTRMERSGNPFYHTTLTSNKFDKRKTSVQYSMGKPSELLSNRGSNKTLASHTHVIESVYSRLHKKCDI